MDNLRNFLLELDVEKKDNTSDSDIDSEIEKDPEEEPEDEDPVEDPEENLEDPDKDSDKDPDKAGLIRSVSNAHLVYKRAVDDGTFDELWIYNISTNVRNISKIKKDILSGTDIPEGNMRSDDGEQRYDLSVVGNAELLHITGLPS